MQKTVENANDHTPHFKPITPLTPHLKRILAGCPAVVVVLPLLIGPVFAA